MRHENAERLRTAWALAEPSNRQSIPLSLRHSGWGPSYSSEGGDTPLRRRLNQILCELGSTISDALWQGVLLWSETTIYSQDAICQRGHVLWRALRITQGDDPLGEGQTAWQRVLGERSEPEAPDGVAGTPGENCILIRWQEPFDGGDPIIGYTVQWRQSGAAYSPVRQATATGLFHEITGLTLDVPYFFRVRAVNSIGHSAWSSEATATVTSTVPGQASIAGSATHDTATILLAVGSNGGSPVTSWVLTRSAPGSTSLSLTEMSATPTFTYTGLMPDASYLFRGYAVNANGKGPGSGLLLLTTTTSVPTAPGLDATGGAERIHVELSPPASDGGRVVTGYEVEWKAPGQSYSSARRQSLAERHGDVLNLANGVEYTLRARALNTNGAGPWSAEATGTPLPSRYEWTIPGTYTFVWPYEARRGRVEITSGSGGQGGAGGGGGGSHQNASGGPGAGGTGGAGKNGGHGGGGLNQGGTGGAGSAAIGEAGHTLADGFASGGGPNGGAGAYSTTNAFTQNGLATGAPVADGWIPGSVHHTDGGGGGGGGGYGSTTAGRSDFDLVDNNFPGGEPDRSSGGGGGGGSGHDGGTSSVGSFSVRGGQGGMGGGGGGGGNWSAGDVWKSILFNGEYILVGTTAEDRIEYLSGRRGSEVGGGGAGGRSPLAVGALGNRGGDGGLGADGESVPTQTREMEFTPGQSIPIRVGLGGLPGSGGRGGSGPATGGGAGSSGQTGSTGSPGRVTIIPLY